MGRSHPFTPLHRLSGISAGAQCVGKLATHRFLSTVLWPLTPAANPPTTPRLVLCHDCFSPLAVCLPVRCCCCCLCCVCIECIAFNIYLLLFLSFFWPLSFFHFCFFFSRCAHFSFLRQGAPASGGRGKLKMQLRLKLHDKRIAKCFKFSCSCCEPNPSTPIMPRTLPA